MSSWSEKRAARRAHRNRAWVRGFAYRPIKVVAKFKCSVWSINYGLYSAEILYRGERDVSWRFYVYERDEGPHSRIAFPQCNLDHIVPSVLFVSIRFVLCQGSRWSRHFDRDELPVRRIAKRNWRVQAGRADCYTARYSHAIILLNAVVEIKKDIALLRFYIKCNMKKSLWCMWDRRSQESVREGEGERKREKQQAEKGEKASEDGRRETSETSWWPC